MFPKNNKKKKHSEYIFNIPEFIIRNTIDPEFIWIYQQKKIIKIVNIQFIKI